MGRSWASKREISRLFWLCPGTTTLPESLPLRIPSSESSRSFPIATPPMWHLAQDCSKIGAMSFWNETSAAGAARIERAKTAAVASGQFTTIATYLMSVSLTRLLTCAAQLILLEVAPEELVVDLVVILDLGWLDGRAE